MEIILASKSPRRRKIFSELGYHFNIYPSDIDEENKNKLLPDDYVRDISEKKAKVSKNEAQVVAGQTLKERQDYYLKLSAKNEHTKDSIQEFYNTLKTGGSEITYNGAVLQQIRKMKSISINELAQITCIRGAYLKAIEEEDFSKFTSEIYLKGYLLCYAESMNLPTEKVLDDYIRVYKNSARSENG